MRMSKVIVDLSEWQRPSAIDYSLLAQGVSYGIIRVQFGGERRDKHFVTHIRELQKRGVPIGVYAWVRGRSVAEMKAEARRFYQRGQEFAPSFWWLDVEEESMPQMAQGVEAYRWELKRLGAKRVGVYVSHHLYQRFKLEVSKFDGIWLPHYGVNNGSVTSQPSYPCDVHQYTDCGRLRGYGGNLDLNRLMGGRSLGFLTGGSGLTSQGSGRHSHLVRRGETASQIALRYGMSLRELRGLNPNHRNWDVIIVGQELVINNGKVKERVYLVQEGDNLWDIAFKLYGDGASFNRLKELNGLSGNRIYGGMRLRY